MGNSCSLTYVDSDNDTHILDFEFKDLIVLQDAINSILNERNKSQLGLFDVEVKETAKQDIYSFDMFWKRFPEKRGKTNTQKMWKREIKNDPEKVIRVYNCLYFYLKDVRDARRRGFMQRFCAGDKFFRNREDFIGYHDTLITNLGEAITKVDIINEQIKQEESINENIMKARSNKFIDLSSKFNEREW